MKSSAQFTVFAKRDCPTCILVEPVINQLTKALPGIEIVVQDDPAFLAGLPGQAHDASLERSFRAGIEAVPTLVRADAENGTTIAVGWNRQEWERLTGIENLGTELPPQRPGCGAKNVEPGVAERLEARFGKRRLQSRRIDIGLLQDDIELAYERGWSDGLPVVPPTEERVVRMLSGTTRDPQEVIGDIPPDLQPCTVEKIAVNAVLAGCKPEYFPVVLTAVEAALEDAFCMHGLLATTWFSGPVVIVNGPVSREIGMNSRHNALGQGNRANATIGRALQLVIRNIGGGRPGEIDRATLGNPGKYTFCFAEDESDPRWTTLHEDRGFDRDASTVTLFAGDGVQGIMDQQSRKPESLARTFAQSLLTVAHAKLAMAADAMLVVSPEHRRIFHEAGWDKARLLDEINRLTTRPGKDLIRGAQDIAEGLPEQLADNDIPKFRPGGLHIVQAGGGAGLFSAIIGGWVASGPIGSVSVTREIHP